MEGFAENGGGGRAGQDRARRGEARRDADCRGQIRFGHRYGQGGLSCGMARVGMLYVCTVSRQAEGGSGFGLGSCSMSLV